MSETTYTFGTNYHSQLIKPHDVIRIWQGSTIQGYSYFRVLKINNYWVKLLYLGKSTGSNSMPSRYSVENYRYPSDCDTNMYLTNIRTGGSANGYPTPYGKGYSSDTYKAQLGADINCIDFYNRMTNNPWHQFPDQNKYYIKENLGPIDMPSCTIFSDAETTTAVTPDYTITNGSGQVYKIKKVGSIDSNLGESSVRYIRPITIEEIFDYFGKPNITSRELANDLLGGKHYFSTDYSDITVDGWLYNSITNFWTSGPEPTKSSDGYGSYIGSYMTTIDVNEYGSFINRSTSSHQKPCLVMLANLRKFENWEVVTNW